MDWTLNKGIGTPIEDSISSIGDSESPIEDSENI